jgi:predicted metalloprotease with PDZ domain
MRFGTLGALLFPVVAAGEPTWRYEVQPSKNAQLLQVEALFPAIPGGRLEAEDGMARFVRDVAVHDGDQWRKLAGSDGSWHVGGCAAGCTVRYAFDLGELARQAEDPDRADVEGGVTVSGPGGWLLRPDAPAELQLHVEPPEGMAFAVGWPPVAGAPNTYRARSSDLSLAPYTALGPLDVRTVAVGDRTVHVAIGPGRTPAQKEAVVAWIQSSADAVRRYVGRFPIDHALVLVLPAGAREINGRTMGSGGATVLLWLGAEVTPEQMRDDWVLVHELTHLLLPNVPRYSHWMEEGLATYVEPLERLRNGTVSVDDVWRQLLWGLPKGLPDADDEGLDNTPSWGNTYWGGALFWFMADLRIRERTHNACALEDALRGLQGAGGTMAARWPVAEIVRAADRAVGGTDLQDLYAEMGTRRRHIDLRGLLRRLGLSGSGREVRFDDKAPLAAVRQGIVSGAPTACRPDGGPGPL